MITMPADLQGTAGGVPVRVTDQPAAFRSLTMNPRRSFWLLALVHAAALLSAAKSFRDNPILGNAALNRGGLHVLRVRLDYAKTGSLRRQAQLGRLAAWRAPSWEEHFRRLQPLIDEAPPEVARHRYA
jgi:hypothetical protein